MKSLIQHFFSIALLSTCLIPTVHAQDLTTRYAESIDYLHEKGVIEGYENGVGAFDFRAEEPITRVEFLKILLSNLSVDTSKLTEITYPYHDVPKEEWFSPYVEGAWRAGMIPYKTLLHPHDPIGRLEATELMLKLLGVHTPRVIDDSLWTLNYLDVSRTSWYAPTVYFGTTYGLIQPLENDYFRPLKTLTRGEATELTVNLENYFLQLISTLINGGATDNTTSDIPHLDIFTDVWNRLHGDFYYSDEINAETLIYHAIQSLVEGAGDPFTTFFPPEEAEAFEQQLEGEVVGIGIQITDTEEGVIITNFISDSPAENSGLQSNDLIIAIDGLDVRGLTATEMASYIRGEEGSDVTLTVERAGEPAPLSLTITRTKLDIGFMSGKVMGNIIYVDINLFDLLSFIEFNKTMNELIDENPDFEGFIFDVRNNPGGYLDSVASILGHFIDNGKPVAYIKYSDTEGEYYPSFGSGEWKNYPIVFLVDGGTASASEIMTISLKESVDAIVVGEQTYGKGTVQQIVSYDDGSSFKYTFAEWLSPELTSINITGITPDHVVELTLDDVLNDRDPQLDTAIQVLQNEIKRRGLLREKSL